MAKPRVLALGELTGADENLFFCVACAIANGKRGGARPLWIQFVEARFFFFESRKEHFIKPRFDAFTQNRAVDLNDGIGGRRLFPFAVESTKKCREIKTGATDDDDGFGGGDILRPMCRGAKPCAR